MLKNFLIFYILLFPFFIYGREVKTLMYLEHATTKEKCNWGLMGRTSLPKDHGMVLHLQIIKASKIWMFNTYIDLSLAFLDKYNRIISTHELKAFPEVMDPSRPVRSLKEMALYPDNDPIIQFFKRYAITVPLNTKYAVEMEKNWFISQGAAPGDRITWNKSTGQAYLIQMR